MFEEVVRTAQEIRPVPQKVGHGPNPDKIMVANRKVGSTQTPEQTESGKAAAQNTRDGLSGLANAESPIGKFGG